MRRFLFFFSGLALVALLVWSASKFPAASPAVPASAKRLPTPAAPCEACAQATLAAALTQERINLSALQAQATATADILQAHALATANAVASTQGVAQTQAKIDANALQAQAAATADVLQAQAAATAGILQAHTLATANALAATQSAAQTQERLNANSVQTQAAAATADKLLADRQATADAASATQSAVQTQAGLQLAQLQRTSEAATQAAAMEQTVAKTATAIALAAFHTRSDATQRPDSGALLWMWLTPILMISAAVLSLWGLSRWQAHRRTRGQSAAPAALGRPLPPQMSNLPPLLIDHPLPPDNWAPPGDTPSGNADELTTPDGRQVRGWLEEVKLKLANQQKE